jgi:hypothetical protein
MTTLPNKRKFPERDLVMKPLLAKLSADDDVIWYERTASFQIGTLRVGHAGAADITAVVNCGNGKIALWFLECKAPGSPIKTLEQLPYEQRKFAKSMEGKPMVGFSIISDPKMYQSEKRRIQQL